MEKTSRTFNITNLHSPHRDLFGRLAIKSDASQSNSSRR
jgi:hypothetical protein